MATSLERPGVKVRRQTTAVTPQALIPILRPMVMGPAYEVLDLYVGAALNSGASLSAPARIVGTQDLTTIPQDGSIRGKSLVLSVKNGAPVTCQFPSNLSTQKYLLAKLSASFSGVTFFMVDEKYLGMQSSDAGDNASVEIMAGTTAQLGLTIGTKAVGAGTYKNQKLGIAFSALPAPRGNGALLSYDFLTDYMDVWYRQGGQIRKFSRDAAVVRYNARHEFGKEVNGNWVNCGFSFLSAPTTPFVVGEQFGLGNRTLVSRPLSGVDDNDRDSKTPKVGSIGAAASRALTFNKPAHLAVAMDTGVTAGTPANIGVLTMVTKPASGLSGARGNLIQYALRVGTVSGIVVTEVGTGWKITQTAANGTGTDSVMTLAAAAAALGACTSVLPGSHAAAGTTTDLTVANVLTVIATGATTINVVDVLHCTPDVISSTPAVFLGSGATSSMTFKGDAEGDFYGSLGNNLVLDVSETLNNAAIDFASGGGTGADPFHLKTWTVHAGPKVNSSTVIADAVGPGKTLTIALKGGAGSVGELVGHPWGGLNGTDVVSFSTADGGVSPHVAVTFATATDGRLLTDITYYFATATPTFTAAKAALEAAGFVNNLLSFTISNGGGDGVLTAAVVTIGSTVAGSDPAASSVVKTTVSAQADHNVVAVQGAVWDEDCPVSTTVADALADGWDPVNFKEGTLDSTNPYFHGVVVGERELGDVLSTVRTAINGTNLILQVNGGEVQDISFSTVPEGDDVLATICDVINTRFTAEVAVQRTIDGEGGGVYFELNSMGVTNVSAGFGRRGLDSSVKVLGGSAIGVLFHDGTDTTRDALYTGLFTGAPLAVKAGDVLYNNDGLLGTVVGIENYAPSSTSGTTVYENAVLVLDAEVLCSATFPGWYVRSTNIDFATDAGTTVAPGPKVLPLPEAFVDTMNRLIVLKDNVVRNSLGAPVTAPKYGMYATYKALRLDLKTGINIRSEEDLQAITPLSTDNPLGLAIQKAFEAGDGIVVSGVGVDEISAASPMGTVDAYRRAASWVASQDVYVTAPLTFNREVHDYMDAFAKVQSDELHKKEQVTILCPEMPTHLASATLGNGSANKSPTDVDIVTFSSEHLNVGAILADAGIAEADWAVEDSYFGLDSNGVQREIYLTLTSNAKNYLVRSVNLSGDTYEVQVHCAVDGDEFWATREGNEDGFYAVEALPAMEIDGEPAAILRRGLPIANTEDQAQALHDLCERYSSILTHVIGPDRIELSVDGSSVLVDGFYGAAIAAAQLCGGQASTPITGQAVPGVVRTAMPEGMTDFEVGIAAAGGYSMMVTENGNVTWRDFLTTKSTPVADFETSMITPDHLAGRIFRAELKPYVGPMAIDASYLGRVSMICDAICKKLVAAHVYQSAKVMNISQDKDDPRQVILEIGRGIYSPARTILVILM